MLLSEPELSPESSTFRNRERGEGAGRVEDQLRAPTSPDRCPALRVKDGQVKIPDGPGWGVQINPAWLDKAAYLKSDERLSEGKQKGDQAATALS